MPYVVTITEPNGKVREYALPNGETTVGRDTTNNLVLEGRGVSRRHAKLLVDGEKITVIDLDSTYGTRVNDIPTTRNELGSRDCLTIGMHKLQLRAVEEGALPDLSMEAAANYFSDDVTLDPHERRTLKLDRSAINFVLDNPGESGQAVSVISSKTSNLMQAVERLEQESASLGDISKTPTPVVQDAADYQALMLMYKVSAQLAHATDLDGFIAPVADMVIEAVNSSTVVILLVSPEGELVPRVIRHRGALHSGEVPVSRAILNLVMSENETVISNDVSHDERINAGQSITLYNICSVIAAPLMMRGEARGILYLNRAGPNAFSRADGELVTALAALVASGMEASALKESVAQENHKRKILERFHPPEVVDRIFRDGGDAGEMEEQNLTALVCDIGGFDQLLAQLKPRELARVLHEYYETIYERVFANGGSLVKVRDGWALALFGSHSAGKRDAVWAVETALSLFTEFDSLKVLWPQAGKLTLRCGLDTGPVVAGFVGPVDRMEYCAIGTPIATASALATRSPGTSLMVTEETWSSLPQKRYLVKETPIIPDRSVYQLNKR